MQIRPLPFLWVASACRIAVLGEGALEFWCFLKQTRSLAGSGDVDTNRFYIKPRVNSAFKRAQPLPRLDAVPEFPGRLDSDRCATCSEVGSFDSSRSASQGSHIINLERARFE